MPSLNACPSKLSFTSTKRVSLGPPLKGNITDFDNAIASAFAHKPGHFDCLFFGTSGITLFSSFTEHNSGDILEQGIYLSSEPN